MKRRAGSPVTIPLVLPAAGCVVVVVSVVDEHGGYFSASAACESSLFARRSVAELAGQFVRPLTARVVAAALEDVEGT